MSDEKDKPLTPVKKRVPGRPFVKGQSGNPGGVPKAAKEMIMLARQGCPIAIRRLTALCEDPDSHPLAAVAAAKELLDRGYGRAPQMQPDFVIDGVSMNGDGGGIPALLLRAHVERREPSPSPSSSRRPPPPSSSMPVLTPEEQKITGLQVMLAQARASTPDGESPSRREVLESLVGKDRASELMRKTTS